MHPPHLLSGEEEDDEVETRVEKGMLEDKVKDKHDENILYKY